MNAQLEPKKQYITVENEILIGYRSDNQIPGSQKESEILYSEGGVGGFLIDGDTVENPPLYGLDGTPLYRWDGASILKWAESGLNNSRPSI